jgi:two-component system response regulator HydG
MADSVTTPRNGEGSFHFATTKLEAGLIGRSEPMQRLYSLIERVAASAAPVLLLGESGTGKELVARAVHFEGPRRERPFVAINCAAIPEALLESELFGHVRGAFTGASGARRGLFVEASGGTLFLDEIGDMPQELQAKLLRVLQEGEIRSVGSDVSRSVDVRVIAATHRDLEQRVREGSFRADLFYRLNVVPIVVPTLRERTTDIPLWSSTSSRGPGRTIRRARSGGSAVPPSRCSRGPRGRAMSASWRT